MQHNDDPLFQIIFNQLTDPCLVVKTDNLSFKIVAINEAFRTVTGNHEDSISGENIWTVLEPFFSVYTGKKAAKEAFERAFQSRVTITLPPFRFSGRLSPHGAYEHSSLQMSVVPVTDNTKTDVNYLLCRLSNVTDRIAAQAALNEAQAIEINLLKEQQDLNEELAAANEELNAINEELLQSQEDLARLNNELEERIERRTRQARESALRFNRMVMNTPVAMAILKGSDFVIDIANQPMLETWSREAEQVLNKPLMEIFPELEGQPFPEMLREVFKTGKKLSLQEQKVQIGLPDGGYKDLYVDFSYDPLFDAEGQVEAILATVIDITEIAEARKLLQLRQEELETMNEEITAANEELVATNEELADTQENLQALFGQLAESEERFRSLFEQAPVGMCFLKGKDLVIDLANDLILKIWGRSREEVIGLPHEEARPELKGQPMLSWLREVYATGLTRRNTELRVNLYDKGGKREAYVNSVYHPLRDASGNVTGLLVLLNEITEAVVSRKQAESSRERFRLAVESAQLGTWFINHETDEFVASTRFKELIGYNPDEEISYEAALNQIHEDYRKIVVNAMEAAIFKGERYDLEYPIVGFHDGRQRWVRATGKMYAAEAGHQANFSGTILDITDRKQEEIRRNDFIAIASHELKTPLTSLKAYLQLLNARTKNEDDNFTKEALSKSLIQIEKMHTLIKGFLDVSKVESGNLHIEPAPFRLVELLQEAAEEASLLSQNHEISLEYSGDPEVVADKDKIAQVVNNFLSNAVKYSPKGKKIILSCKKVQNEVQVSVCDEGMGIKPQDLGKLFDRFYRVESKHTKTISGFGIGLYLCAEIIRRHNGKVWAESESGKGSVFYFSLPL